jgi:hypothetical protein
MSLLSHHATEPVRPPIASEVNKGQHMTAHNNSLLPRQEYIDYVILATLFTSSSSQKRETATVLDSQ